MLIIVSGLRIKAGKKEQFVPVTVVDAVFSGNNAESIIAMTVVSNNRRTNATIRHGVHDKNGLLRRFRFVFSPRVVYTARRCPILS